MAARGNLMRDKGFIVGLLLISIAAGGNARGAEIHDWENPQILGINKLPYHASLQLPSLEKECGEIVSLDGNKAHRYSFILSSKAI